MKFVTSAQLLQNEVDVLERERPGAFCDRLHRSFVPKISEMNHMLQPMYMLYTKRLQPISTAVFWKSE